MAKSKNEVEVVKKNEVAVLDFAADAGAGLEGADNASFAVPFLSVLQGLSPALETVDGAKPGLMINTITNELFKELHVIPCAFQRRFLRWDGAQRGKYKGDLSPIDVETGKLVGATKDDKGQWRIGGDVLKDTRNHYVMYRTVQGSWKPALLSLGSTQIKKSKRWLSLIQGVELPGPNGGRLYNPASFSHVYKVTTLKEENDLGAWFGVNIELDGPVSDAELYAAAKAFNKQVAAGMVITEPPAADAPEAF